MAVSLENFIQRATPPMVLNTPRSIEACRAEGIDPSDMHIIEMKEFSKEFAPETDEAVIEQHYTRYVRR